MNLYLKCILVILVTNLCSLDARTNYIFKLKYQNQNDVTRFLRCRYVKKDGDLHVCRSSKIYRSIRDIKLRLPARLNVIHIHRTKKNATFPFNDPGIIHQWYLVKSGSSYLSHDISSLWKMGITGKGIVVGIVDAGIDIHHKELIKNYNPKASFNFLDEEVKLDSKCCPHGNFIAGIISGTANNGICGVGVAPSSTFGSLQIIKNYSDNFRDSLEASALNFKNNYISIYCSSWGPLDDGLSMRGPGPITIEVLKIGYARGRRGAGNLYLFPTGNGNINGDNCAFDGYVQREEIMGITSMARDGSYPNYIEKCTAIIAATLANKGKSDPLYSPGANNDCGLYAGYTSGSNALAAGIFSLVLQEKFDIKPRELLYLIARTSHQTGESFVTNAAGYNYSIYFGFGLLNARALVYGAKTFNFSSLPQLHRCHTPYFKVSQMLNESSNIVLYTYISGCAGTNYVVTHVEQLFFTFTIETNNRNLIEIFLTSPSNTKVKILQPRAVDNSTEGFKYWTLKILNFYGEPVKGFWEIEITSTKNAYAELKNWKLLMIGFTDDSTVALRNIEGIDVKSFHSKEKTMTLAPEEYDFSALLSNGSDLTSIVK